MTKEENSQSKSDSVSKKPTDGSKEEEKKSTQGGAPLSD